MTAIMVDPVSGWAVRPVKHPVTHRAVFEITVDGGIDHGRSPYVTTVAQVRRTIGRRAFARLATPPATVPTCEAV